MNVMMILMNVHHVLHQFQSFDRFSGERENENLFLILLWCGTVCVDLCDELAFYRLTHVWTSVYLWLLSELWCFDLVVPALFLHDLFCSSFLLTPFRSDLPWMNSNLSTLRLLTGFSFPRSGPCYGRSEVCVVYLQIDLCWCYSNDELKLYWYRCLGSWIRIRMLLLVEVKAEDV